MLHDGRSWEAGRQAGDAVIGKLSAGHDLECEHLIDDGGGERLSAQAAANAKQIRSRLKYSHAKIAKGEFSKNWWIPALDGGGRPHATRSLHNALEC